MGDDASADRDDLLLLSVVINDEFADRSGRPVSTQHEMGWVGLQQLAAPYAGSTCWRVKRTRTLPSTRAMNSDRCRAAIGDRGRWYDDEGCACY